jgi:hypothetical protein
VLSLSYKSNINTLSDTNLIHIITPTYLYPLSDTIPPHTLNVPTMSNQSTAPLQNSTGKLVVVNRARSTLTIIAVNNVQTQPQPPSFLQKKGLLGGNKGSMGWVLSLGALQCMLTYVDPSSRLPITSSPHARPSSPAPSNVISQSELLSLWNFIAKE